MRAAIRSSRGYSLAAAAAGGIGNAFPTAVADSDTGLETDSSTQSSAWSSQAQAGLGATRNCLLLLRRERLMARWG